MKTKWKEKEVNSLPEGEHDFFERKSGVLFEKPHFRDSLSKAISAFANSGGGHLLLGVKDDGTSDGIPEAKGKTPIREYIEQILPHLVDHPLSTFRVHKVIPSRISNIPKGKVIIVIDIGDSPHAPHQARNNNTYYFRSGGHSKPAPHFYLEALRNRAVLPVLSAIPTGLLSLYANNHDDGLFLQICVAFEIGNSGKNLARHWLISIECKNNDLVESGTFRLKDFPKGRVILPPQKISKQTPLLPSLSASSFAFFGLNLKPDAVDKKAIQKELDCLFEQNLEIFYSVVNENTRSEEFPLEASLLREWLSVENILWALPFSSNPHSLYGGHGLFCNHLRFLGEPSDKHLEMTCHIENRTGPSYLDLSVAVILKDSEGRSIHVETFHFDRLENGVSRQKTAFVDRSEIQGMCSTHFVFLSDLPHKSTDNLRPFGGIKILPSDSPDNSGK